MTKQKCECCRKEIEKQTSRKFCNACSLFTSDLKRKISSLKLQNHKLKLKIYYLEDKRQKI